MRRKLTSFEVTGRGSFPLDMLRYDSCWPADPDAVSDMEYSTETRTIRLRTYNRPTIERWRSFMWGAEIVSW